MRKDPSDCDFHSIPLAMLPTLFLLCSTFPIFRFALLSSYTSSQLLSGALCFKLIYLYGYLSWILLLSSLFIYFFNHYGLCILTYLYTALSFYYLQFPWYSMHLGYGTVKPFSLKRFPFFIFQFWFSSYDLSILSPFDVTLLMQLFSSLTFCDCTFILRLPTILFSFQYFCGIIP